MILHTKYQGSRHYGFRQEDFPRSSLYKPMLWLCVLFSYPLLQLVQLIWPLPKKVHFMQIPAIKQRSRFEIPVSLYILHSRPQLTQPYYTVKTCVKRPLKIDRTKILMTNGSLMQVKSIAECSNGSKVLQNAPDGVFCNTFELR